MAHDHSHDGDDEHDHHDHARHSDAPAASSSTAPAPPADATDCRNCGVEPDAHAAESPPHVHGHHGDEDGHAHAHTHDFRDVAITKLKTAFALTLGFMFVEVAAGIYGRSLTLASDGGHMLADAGALLLALIAQRFASRRATPDRTYGFRRAETLAAFVNGVALTGTALVVLSEAWQRFRSPVAMRAELVVIVACIGLAVNLVSAWILSRGTSHNLNTRAALAHVAFDAVGSVVAITAGLVSWKFHWYRLDPILSVAMAALILFGAWSILKGTVTVLMEGTPSGLDLAELQATIRATPGVAELHDLHAWTISDGFDSITVHVVLDGTRHGTEVARDVGRRIHAIHRVAHVTVQPEAPAAPSDLRPPSSLVPHTN